MKDLVIVGNISQDHVIHAGETKRIAIGGAALNVGIGSKMVGMTPCLISVIGDDIPQEVLSVLKEHFDTFGVLACTGSSCSFRLIYEDLEQSPQIFTDAGVSIKLTDHARETLIETRHLHLCCRLPLDPAQVINAWEKKALPTLSVDFIHSSFAQQFKLLKPYLEFINYVFLNEKEYELLKENIDPATIAPTIIITRGSRGAIALKRGQQLFFQPACLVDKPIDTTGAGDTFAGAFLGCVLQNMSIEQAMQRASAIAAQSVNDFDVMHLLQNLKSG